MLDVRGGRVGFESVGGEGRSVLAERGGEAVAQIKSVAAVSCICDLSAYMANARRSDFL